MTFSDITPTAIQESWRQITYAQFQNITEHSHMITLQQTPILSDITKHVISVVAYNPSNISRDICAALVLALRIGFNLREYMENRWKDANELNRIVSDTELTEMLATIKIKGITQAK